MTYKTLTFVVVMALSMLILPSYSRADFTAIVISVAEGDKLTISHKGRNQTIRLLDIDCPELKQPYGKQARNVTVAFVGGREVVVRGLHRNRQGLTTAEVLLQDGRNVGYELVKEGLAWVKPETPGGRGLAEVERISRAEGKGLWSEPRPVPPWQWKLKKKFQQ